MHQFFLSPLHFWQQPFPCSLWCTIEDSFLGRCSQKPQEELEYRQLEVEVYQFLEDLLQQFEVSEKIEQYIRKYWKIQIVSLVLIAKSCHLSIVFNLLPT